MSARTVGVVIAALDAERFIEEAIRSALQQTRPPDRIVVVDDGSTDSTAAIAGSFGAPVVVLRRGHAGLGPSRNAGLAMVDTDLVALLDADDLWLSNKLELQVAALVDDPACEAAFCLVDEFLDGVEPGPGKVREPRLAQPVPLASSALFRRSLIELVGPFHDAPVGDWVRWWARARALGITHHVVPEVLARRRIHGANNSLRHGASGGEVFLDIARDHLRELRRERSTRAESTD